MPNKCTVCIRRHLHELKLRLLCTSLISDGWCEIGNGEELNELDQVPIVSWLLVEDKDVRARQKFAMHHNFPPVALFTASERTEWLAGNRNSFAPLKADLPANVFLMTLQQHGANSDKVAMRFNHVVQADATWASPRNEPTSFELADVFKPTQFMVVEIEERTLSLNNVAEQCTRHHWHMDQEPEHEPKYGTMVARDSLAVAGSSKLQVALGPLDIRSFVVTLEGPKKE
jgi:hypothetical protein